MPNLVPGTWYYRLSEADYLAIKDYLLDGDNDFFPYGDYYYVSEADAAGELEVIRASDEFLDGMIDMLRLRYVDSVHGFGQ